MFFEMPGTDPRVAPDVAGTAVDFVRPCIDAGRFAPADPWSVMWQLWTVTHGLVAGVLAGMIAPSEVEERMRLLGLTLYIGFGDDPAAAERSLDRARRQLQGDGP